MVINSGRYGNYYACSNYPECQNIKAVNEKVVIPTDKICSKCGAMMVEREGKFGKFLACSNYPKCKNTVSMTESVGVCPDCGSPTKKMTSRGGKVFYGCSKYPDCKFMSWDMPTGTRCDVCGEPMVKTEEGVGCSNKDCKKYLPPKRVSKAKPKVTKLKEGENAPPPLMDEPIYSYYEDGDTAGFFPPDFEE